MQWHLCKKHEEEKEEGLSRNMYKGHMGKDKEGKDRGWEVGMAGVGGMVGGKWRQLYLNNNKIKRRYV